MIFQITEFFCYRYTRISEHQLAKNCCVPGCTFLLNMILIPFNHRISEKKIKLNKKKRYNPCLPNLLLFSTDAASYIKKYANLILSLLHPRDLLSLNLLSYYIFRLPKISVIQQSHHMINNFTAFQKSKWIIVKLLLQIKVSSKKSMISVFTFSTNSHQPRIKYMRFLL
jgi:hypothetical protein